MSNVTCTTQCFSICLQSGLVLLLLSCCASHACYIHALHYHSSGFFIIISPAEGLHFSALICLVTALLIRPFRARIINVINFNFYVQHSARQVMSMLTINIINIILCSFSYALSRGVFQAKIFVSNLSFSIYGFMSIS